MTDKENLSPAAVPQNLFFSQPANRKKSLTKGRYNKNVPQEFDRIENSIMEETETESLRVTKTKRKISELIRPENKIDKAVHVRKVSDDDLVIFKEEEVQKPLSFLNRAKSGFLILCRCVKRG